MVILFVNHTGAFSGAENALLRLLECLPAEHERAVACPPGGSLSTRLRERGVDQYPLRGTELSLALHPVRTLRGVAELVRSAVALRRTARRLGAGVVHANSVRAGLIGTLARLLGGPPVVVQCHDHLPRTRVGALTRSVLAHGASAVVAVSDSAAREFNHGLSSAKARRIYISLDHRRFSPEARDESAMRRELGLPADTPLLAQVAQITPWKGQDVAIRALALVRERVDAHLLVVGQVAFSSQRYDNAGFRRSLDRLAAELGVEDAVHFLGERDDVPRVIGGVDLLLLPSWEEPFGLVVAESMAVGTPVLVTDRGGVREYVRDGVDGRLLPPLEPRAWADAALELLDDRPRRVQMGERAVDTARQFDDARYCRDMLEVYCAVARA